MSSAAIVNACWFTMLLIMPSTWSGEKPDDPSPLIVDCAATLPLFTASARCAWCSDARFSHIVVEIDVPNAPAVIRAKFVRPDAAGILSGHGPDSLVVVT